MAKDKAFLLRVEPGLHRRVKAAAKRADMTINAFVRLVLMRAEAAGLWELVETTGRKDHRRERKP